MVSERLLSNIFARQQFLSIELLSPMGCCCASGRKESQAKYSTLNLFSPSGSKRSILWTGVDVGMNANAASLLNIGFMFSRQIQFGSMFVSYSRLSLNQTGIVVWYFHLDSRSVNFIDGRLKSAGEVSAIVWVHSTDNDAVALSWLLKFYPGVPLLILADRRWVGQEQIAELYDLQKIAFDRSWHVQLYSDQNEVFDGMSNLSNLVDLSVRI